uniref:Selenoprotein P2 n=1 Tax=Fundulus heteroclitus TaxID=8078 RepID=A0A3Q2R3L7_FUNHE
MRSLLVLWLSAALPGLLWVFHSAPPVEGDNDLSRICKPAPNWTIDGSSPMEERKGNVVVVALQASRIGRLRTKLTSRNITGVSFVIVNDQDAVSRSKYKELKKRAPERVPVYQQSANQSDVWELLEGDKDDILIYDWCGHLTFHMVLPYTLLHNTHVENAISATYQGNICNCSVSDQIRGHHVVYLICGRVNTSQNSWHHHHRTEHEIAASQHFRKEGIGTQVGLSVSVYGSIYHPYSFILQGQGRLVSFSSNYWATGGVHLGRIGSPSQGNIETHRTNNHAHKHSQLRAT